MNECKYKEKQKDWLAEESASFSIERKKWAHILSFFFFF